MTPKAEADPTWIKAFKASVQPCNTAATNQSLTPGLHMRGTSPVSQISIAPSQNPRTGDLRVFDDTPSSER